MIQLFNKNSGLKELPNNILVVLPFTLFFPIGIMYAVLGFFILALLLSGDYALKIGNIRNSPLFFPALALLILSLLSSLFISTPTYHPFEHLLHYQIYFVLLMLISVGGGD